MRLIISSHFFKAGGKACYWHSYFFFHVDRWKTFEIKSWIFIFDCYPQLNQIRTSEFPFCEDWERKGSSILENFLTFSFGKYSANYSESFERISVKTDKSWETKSSLEDAYLHISGKQFWPPSSLIFLNHNCSFFSWKT